MTPVDPQRTILENVVWGVKIGLSFAAVLVVWVIVIYLISGDAAFANINTTLAKTIIAYLGGGAAAGAIIGLCRPLLRSQLAAAIVGVLAAVPVIVMGKYSVDPGPWSSADVFAVTALPLFYGLVLGPIFYRQVMRRRHRRGEARDGVKHSQFTEVEHSKNE
jgi:hypothetical protein